MEIINQYNAAGQHGYYKDEFVKRHYYNNSRIGLEQYNRDSCYVWQCHYFNDYEIGCELMNEAQYFYNKSSKKFGEQIEWE